MKLRFAHLMLVLIGFAMAPVAGLAVTPPTPPRTPSPMAGPNKAVHDAQAAVELAKKQFLVIRHSVEVQFAAKPEYKAAKANVDKAKAEYDAANRKALAALDKNPEYTALVAKRDKAQAVLDQESHPAAQPSGDDPIKLTDEQITAASKDRTEAGLAIISMQKSVADNNPAIAGLQQKLQDARTAWDAIQAQIDDAVKLDPGYPQAEQAVTQAEAQLKQARDSLAQAAQSQRQAEEQKLKSRSSGGGTAR